MPAILKNAVRDLGVSIRKFLVIAKYEFYLEEILKTVTNPSFTFFTGTSLQDLLYLVKKNPDIEMIFFPHFSEIIPESVYREFKCIGFHTGNLPLDKGGSPIQHQIVQGSYSTKVSAIEIVASIDGGPIYSQRDFNLSKGSISEILGRLATVIAEMIFDLTVNLPKPIPQSGNSAIQRRLSAKDSNLDIESLSNLQIYDRTRMVDGLDYPRAFILIGGVKLVLSEAEFDGVNVSFRARIER
jgi:methionyl-tRNA formyltransferase